MHVLFKAFYPLDIKAGVYRALRALQGNDLGERAGDAFNALNSNEK